MANFKNNNDIRRHLAQLKLLGSCVGARIHNNECLLKEKKCLLEAFNKLKSEDINLVQERTTLVQECIQREKKIIELIQYGDKVESFSIENKKIWNENNELKVKLNQLTKGYNEELAKENGQLNTEFLEATAKEYAEIEKVIDTKLMGLRDLWLKTNNGYKSVVEQYLNRVRTVRENINRLEFAKKSFENRFTAKNYSYQRKYVNDKNYVKALAEESAEYVSKQGDEDTAKAILESVTTMLENVTSEKPVPDNVQFRRKRFLKDTIHKNIFGKQNVASNTKCYKKNRQDSESEAGPSEATEPAAKVYLRGSSYAKRFRRR